MTSTLHNAHNMDVLRATPDNSVDSVVTDPPYDLTSIQERFGKEDAAPAQFGTDGAFARLSKGFMGQTWDGTGIAFTVEFWAEVLRVLKPGGHLLSMGGSRTFHRMVVAIEDAGFEVRDCITWHYATGFPKSLNISKALASAIPADTQCACAHHSTQTVGGYQESYSAHRGPDDVQPPSGEDTDPSVAPSLADARVHSRGGLRVGAQASLPTNTSPDADTDHLSTDCSPRPTQHQLAESPTGGNTQSGTQGSKSPALSKASHRKADHTLHTPSSDDGSVASSFGTPIDRVYPNLPQCATCGKVVIEAGFGTALKPATEFITVARKPISEQSVARNVLRWGTGAINIDACRVGTTDTMHIPSRNGGRGGRAWRGLEGRKDRMPSTFEQHREGRWPANLILTHSPNCNGVCTEDCPVRALDEQSGQRTSGKPAGKRNAKTGFSTGITPGAYDLTGYGDTGGASRFYTTFEYDPDVDIPFFYCAKASRSERNKGLVGVANSHPTVKPVALMRWLCRLVTPPGGTVLDPFMGSNTTGVGATLEGFDFVGCEQDTEEGYFEIAKARQANAEAEVARVAGSTQQMEMQLA